MFQSTRPAWGRDRAIMSSLRPACCFNPRAPRGGATARRWQPANAIVVSIHAPRVGARHRIVGRYADRLLFQSTRPAWGRDILDQAIWRRFDVSIHAPRVGARPHQTQPYSRGVQFQSTRPAWGRDAAQRHPRRSARVSIHAPRVGARRDADLRKSVLDWFQSTRPAWGRDRLFGRGARLCGGFNPRAPRGGATTMGLLSCDHHSVSIHAPRVGARLLHRFVGQHRRPVSIHAPRVGARQSTDRTGLAKERFQSTRPAWGRDQVVLAGYAGTGSFNPRAPRGGATASL